MNPLFNVTEDDLKHLSSIGLADFVNRLLRAEGSRIGLSPMSIHTTLRINTPDAGVDARISENDRASDWIPLGTSIWQFKSGEDHAPATLREEFYKPDVLEVLKAGGAYRVVVSDDLGNIKLKNRVNALTECCLNTGIPIDRVELLAADKIATWAREHPSMRLLLPGPTLGGLYRWSNWAAHSLFSQGYSADQQRSDIIAAFRHILADPSGSILMRIEGLTGIGKSRLGLEVLRPQTEEDGLAERMLYAEGPEAVPNELWHWMETTPKAELILVVDECEREQSDSIERQAQRSNGRVRVITIGRARDARLSDRARPDFFLLDCLNDAAMRDLLKIATSGLPEPAYDFAVRVASGYVKIAVRMTEAMRKHPERVSLHAMLSQDYDIRAVIRDFLVNDEEDLRTMRALALMRRVGWDDELHNEGQAVVALVGLDWHETRSRVKRLTDEGIIVKQGRYRYVTPHLLAVWLASEVWEIYGDETLRLLDNLPSNSSKLAFLERLRDVGDDPHAQRVCEVMLSSKGQFRDLAALDGDWPSQIFGLLAEAHPKAGLRALQRLLDTLPRAEILAFKRGRRQIVWLLEWLAWQPEAFESASRLLLALAEAENETWENNASQTWEGLFGTYLGNTAAPALKRHALIAEALDKPFEGCQLLAVRAINRVLTRLESTSVSSNVRSGRVMPERWNPETWDEDRLVRLSGLKLLDRALASKSAFVREAAEEVLLKQVCEIALAGLVDELLDRLTALPIRDFDQRRKVREATERVLIFERLPLTSDQRKNFERFFENLAGESYHERVRRWVGQHSFADARRERLLGADAWGREAALLADDGVRHPELLQPELGWLASEQAQFIYPFARRLGELDIEHLWWPDIEALVRGGTGSALAAAYLVGTVEAGHQQWRDCVLDTWALEGSHLAHAVLDAVYRSTPPSDQDAERLFNLMDKGWLSASQVSILAWGGKSSPLTLTGLQKILAAILQEEGVGATDIALELIYNRLSSIADDESSLEPLAWQALERPYSLAHDAFYAEELITRYMPNDPIRAVRLALRQVEEAEPQTTLSSNTIDVLQKAAHLDPQATWEEVSLRLLPLEQKYYSFYLALQGWYANAIGSKILLPWAEANKPDGPSLVALLTQVSGQPMNDLARELLIHYQEDSGVGESLSARFASGKLDRPNFGMVSVAP